MFEENSDSDDESDGFFGRGLPEKRSASAAPNYTRRRIEQLRELRRLRELLDDQGIEDLY